MKLTRMPGKKDKNRWHDKCRIDYVFTNISTELNGVESRLNEDSGTTAEGKMKKLDSP